ncbi:MAG: GNAT family N-acetyltransferase [Brumimicrobium sp.]
MGNTVVFNEEKKPNNKEKKEVVDFLHRHLDEFGDASEDIERALKYAVKDAPSFGGFVLVEYEENMIAGAVIVNETGMSGYIPENILVYIAVNREMRGKGLGKKLMDKAVELAKGDVALHVEADNPAVKLYEKVGFTNKYLEMRYAKKH